MIELRSFTTSLEVREDGRTITGVAVPYGVETRIGHYLESFAPGAFAGTEPATVALTATHPRSGDILPIGPTVELRDEPDGLHGAWFVSKTQFGDEVLELVRDRAITGLSIGFVPIPEADRWNADRTRVERRRAVLDHVAVVRVPAYPDARIAALRAAGEPVGGHPHRLLLARLRSGR